ncbi:MAG: alpha/beta hydrolase [Pantoea sp.]|uniref:alpha/beta fold hydrolase n=1 Tax=Pantoea septica TaxID=472695 RepID=UPI0023F43B91|nr:alpha/beta hydrolase [Pantoea septica]MDU5836998.1 alpha/beta hydrolase [Pantoea sp.]MDU6441546.1 alpha/beta hydrolase [Pantoea sp.]
MFEGFIHTEIALSDATINVRYGGSGPPLMLLHGHPRTHVTWSKVAPRLAKFFTVVCPDLRGFGRSSKPADLPDHAGSAKRAKAKDCIELMRHLGFARFALVGHDRGSYTAYRAALDYPDSITRLAVLDSVPILEALERCNERFARQWYHWFFFAQPEKPERAILADPDQWYGPQPKTMGDEEYQAFRQAIHDPATVHGMLEDYRAGLSIDREHERRIARPDVLSPARPYVYGQSRTIWRICTAIYSLSGGAGRRMCAATRFTAAIIWRKRRLKSWWLRCCGFSGREKTNRIQSIIP